MRSDRLPGSSRDKAGLGASRAAACMRAYFLTFRLPLFAGATGNPAAGSPTVRTAMCFEPAAKAAIWSGAGYRTLIPCFSISEFPS